MIIYLKEGAQLVPDITNSDAIENIVYNCRIGNHILLGDRKLLDNIATNFGLNDRTRSFLRYSAQRMTQQGRLIDKVSWALTVDTSNSSGEHVPLKTFSNADYCEKAQLLTENISDARLLTSLAEHLLGIDLKGYRMAIRHISGGGSTTAQCLEELSSSPSGAFLCVVDSDRPFIGASIGDTAKGAKEKYKKIKEKWRSGFHMIEQRELENLLPVEVTLHCAQKHALSSQEQTEALQQTSTFFRDYFCIKHGDSTCRVVTSIIRKKQKAKLLEAKLHLESKLDKAEGCGTCALDNNCRKSPAFGSGLLAIAARELSEGNIRLDSARWRAELLELLERVISYGLGSSPVRI